MLAPNIRKPEILVSSSVLMERQDLAEYVQAAIKMQIKKEERERQRKEEQIRDQTQTLEEEEAIRHSG